MSNESERLADAAKEYARNVAWDFVSRLLGVLGTENADGGPVAAEGPVFRPQAHLSIPAEQAIQVWCAKPGADPHWYYVTGLSGRTGQAVLPPCPCAPLMLEPQPTCASCSTLLMPAALAHDLTTVWLCKSCAREKGWDGAGFTLHVTYHIQGASQ